MTLSFCFVCFHLLFRSHAFHPHCSSDVCILCVGKLLAAEHENASQAVQIKSLQGYMLCFVASTLSYLLSVSLCCLDYASIYYFMMTLHCGKAECLQYVASLYLGFVWYRNWSVLCVCLCVWTITFQWNDFWPGYVTCWFVLTLCSLSSKVRVHSSGRKILLKWTV